MRLSFEDKEFEPILCRPRVLDRSDSVWLTTASYARRQLAAEFLPLEVTAGL